MSDNQSELIQLHKKHIEFLRGTIEFNRENTKWLQDDIKWLWNVIDSLREKNAVLGVNENYSTGPNGSKHFDFDGNDITFVFENGKLWFIAKEVCDVLGYKNSRKAISDHCKHSKKMTVTNRYGQRGGARYKTIIPEGDFFRLAARSKLPEAERFELWVFDEVLPQIRMTGSYTHRPVEQKALPFSSDEWLKVKQIPWVKKIFKRDEMAYKILSRALDMVSDDIEIDKYFHITAIDDLEDIIKKDESILKEYRK
jgi:prophage antirepressor-like protein